MDNIDKRKILDAIKEFYNIKFNNQFAEFLGVGNTVLSSWYSRNSINWELIFTKCKELDFDRLIREGIALKRSIAHDISITGEKKVEYLNETKRVPDQEKESDECKLCVEKDKLIAKFESQLERQEREIHRYLDMLNK